MGSAIHPAGARFFGPFASCAVALLSEAEPAAALLTLDGHVRWANQSFVAMFREIRDLDRPWSPLESPSARKALLAALSDIASGERLVTRRVMIEWSSRGQVLDIALTHLETEPEHLVLARFDDDDATRVKLERAAHLESTLRRMTSELSRLALGERAGAAVSNGRPMTPLPADMPRRQREIAELVLQGMEVDDIARKLALSPHTVRNHLKAVFRRVGVHSRAELLARICA